MNAQSKIELAGPRVYAAISNVMAHMAKEGIGKNRKNSQQGYNFRGIDDVYNALASVLAENRLVILPFVQDMQREERATKSGGALNYTILTVDFQLVSAEDGSSHTVRTVGEAMDSADKSSNKAQSAALKYAAMEVFMIPTEGDNDADATTHELAARREEPQGMPDAEWAKLAGLVKATGSSVGDMTKFFGVAKLEHLNQDQYAEAVEMLNKKLAKAAKAETNAKAGFAEELGDAINF